MQALAVHEYTLAGNNRLELVIEPAAPAPEPRLSEGPRAARVQLLLDFAPGLQGQDVPDPYYGPAAGFDRALARRSRPVLHSGA